MASYRKVLVGTDGSDSSFRAVDRARATIAADSEANLLIVCAYKPAKSTGEAARRPRQDPPSTSSAPPPPRRRCAPPASAPPPGARLEIESRGR